MNKKGFTLIELLASITIMLLIATIASINIISIFDNKNKEKKKEEENILTSAACVYIELNKNIELKSKCLESGCDISTSTLISEGLLSESDVSNEQVIHIEKENNSKICTIKN